VKLLIKSGCIIGVFILGTAFQAEPLHAEGAGGPKILIKALQSEGNTVVSSRAIEALFEREFGVWPIPEAGLKARPEQIQKFLQAIGAFYFRCGSGGALVYIPKGSLEKVDPPALKDGVLKVGVIEAKDKDVETPVEDWMSAQGELTDAQGKALAEAKAKAEEARLQKEKEAAEAEAKKKQLDELKKACQEAERILKERREQTQTKSTEGTEGEGAEEQEKLRQEAEQARQVRIKLIEEARREAERVRKEREAREKAD